MKDCALNVHLPCRDDKFISCSSKNDDFDDGERMILKIPLDVRLAVKLTLYLCWDRAANCAPMAVRKGKDSEWQEIIKQLQ